MTIEQETPEQREARLQEAAKQFLEENKERMPRELYQFFLEKMGIKPDEGAVESQGEKSEALAVETPLSPEEEEKIKQGEKISLLLGQLRAGRLMQEERLKRFEERLNDPKEDNFLVLLDLVNNGVVPGINERKITPDSPIYWTVYDAFSLFNKRVIIPFPGEEVDLRRMEIGGVDCDANLPRRRVSRLEWIGYEDLKKPEWSRRARVIITPP